MGKSLFYIHHVNEFFVYVITVLCTDAFNLHVDE